MRRRLRQSIPPSAVCRLPSAVCRPPSAVCRLHGAAWEVSSATLRVAGKDVALQFADALTRLRTMVVPGANQGTVQPVTKPAAKSPAQGAIP